MRLLFMFSKIRSLRSDKVKEKIFSFCRNSILNKNQSCYLTHNLIKLSYLSQFIAWNCDRAAVPQVFNCNSRTHVVRSKTSRKSIDLSLFFVKGIGIKFITRVTWITRVLNRPPFLSYIVTLYLLLDALTTKRECIPKWPKTIRRADSTV